MARFCGNCGAQIDENAKVCGQCGTPVEDSTKMPPVKVVDSEKKKKNKKIFKAMIALALVAVVAVTAINVVSKFTGYNGLLRKVMTAYEGYDIDTLVSLSSDIYYYGEEDYVESYFENSVGSALDSFETSVGHSYQFSYEVNETYTMSERKTKEVLDIWSRIKGDNLGVGITILIFVVVALMSGWMIYKKWQRYNRQKQQRRRSRRKKVRRN